MADVRLGLDPKDYRFINPNPDPDFSPEHNKAIVDETIKDAENYYKMLHAGNDEDLGNRIDILSSYGRYRFNKGTKQIQDYLGREMYEKIVGEKLMEKLRVAQATNKLFRTNKIKKGVLL